MMDNITVSLGPFKNAANEGGTCPKCGGSKPTCCRCPEPERQPIGPSWEAVEIAERLANPAIGKIKIPEWRAMVTEIALALDEAATQGQVMGIERAAQACDDLRANRPTTEKGLLIATECAVAIRALCPDLSYLNPERTESTQQAVQNGLEWAKKVDKGLIEQVASLKRNEEGYLIRITELERERDEAATAALEQERKRVKQSIADLSIHIRPIPGSSTEQEMYLVNDVLQALREAGMPIALDVIECEQGKRQC